MDQLVAALRDSLAQDQARLDAASLYFSSLSAGAAPWLLEALLALVSVPELEAAVRQQAGLQLRRLLQTSSLAPELVTTIRPRLLALLGCETWRPSVVAPCVLTALEHHGGAAPWPELVPALVAGLKAGTALAETMETLGLVAASPGQRDLVQRNIDQILTVTVHCAAQPEERLQVAALATLADCLDCAVANFAREAERNMILQVVCEATQSPSVAAAGAALDCLARAVDCYLPLLEAYLAPALLPICLAALGSPHPGLVMRGLELWASLARREQDMETGGESSLATSLVQGDTIARLVAALLAIILRAPDSDRDLELWSPSAAAVLCLAELAAWPQCGAARLLGLHVAQLGAAASLGWAEVHSCLVTLPGLLGMESREDVASLVTSFLPLAPPLLTSHPASYVRRATAAAVARIAEAGPSLPPGPGTQLLQLVSLCLGSEDAAVFQLGCAAAGAVSRQAGGAGAGAWHEATLRHLASLTLSHGHLGLFSALEAVIENSPRGCQHALGGIQIVNVLLK